MSYQVRRTYNIYNWRHFLNMNYLRRTKLASNAEWYTLCILLCKIACWGVPQSPKTAPWRSWLRVPLERFSGQKPDRLLVKRPRCFSPGNHRKSSALFFALSLFFFFRLLFIIPKQPGNIGLCHLQIPHFLPGAGVFRIELFLFRQK